MVKRVLTEEMPSWNQMVAIVSLLDADLSREQLVESFGQENADMIIRHAGEMDYLEQRGNAYRFAVPTEKITTQELAGSMLVRPAYYMWERGGVDRKEFHRLWLRLTQITKFSDEMCITIYNQIGMYAERQHNLPLAVLIYNETIIRARQIPELGSRKSLLVRSVLNISKVEFMRGVSPRQTLKCQHEALRMVHQANLSAEDALLLIYTGMSEHFCGSSQEGDALRKVGIDYLEQFNYAELEAEAMPLVGWHDYLRGNFTGTIAYYESLILAIENREDTEIVAFAYPPIIFSYMFMGEYHRALILTGILRHTALENQDHYTATLMLAHMGRAYVYMGDLEKAETVLYQAYAESLQQDYGWGLYYTLLGICYLQFKKANHLACREALAMGYKTAQEYSFSPISASPFTLDVLKMIDDQGLEPIEGVTFQIELQEGLASQNIHISGVSHRLLALQQMKEGCDQERILQSLKSSVKLLEPSGACNQLGETYLVYAQYFRDRNKPYEVQKYARLAWSCQTEDERKNFPRDLAEYVVTKDYQLSLSTLLETLWLELRHIINPERLVARLVTTMCRQLRAEGGAFLLRRDKRLQVVLAQNVERDPQSAQYRRMMAITAYVEQGGTIFSVQNTALALQQELDLQQCPRFCVCIPFFNKDQVGAMLFLESYYREESLTKEECQSLEDFSRKLSAHLLATLEYSDTRPEGATQEGTSEAAGGTQGEFCPSIDETVLVIQAQISKIATTNVPVLITGETGVGKEVFCNEVFTKSGGQDPFVKVNCGAIPESLIESELFGYERGSFTGAAVQRKGYFELAHGGTLFLDEIGELTLQAQVKLLRVLQDHEFIRVGGMRPVKVDFRLIAATNKDLQREVERGTFRKDLYYRLNVVQLTIPPLRERKTDITNMARFFVNKFCQQAERPFCQFSPDALVWMLDYDWPGNIRELENLVWRAVLLAEGNVITSDMLFQRAEAAGEPRQEKFVTLDEMERRYIQRVLRACGGRIAGVGGAAEILGMKRTTLNSRMERLGIRNVPAAAIGGEDPFLEKS